MINNGTIVLVEDDKDDIEVISEIIKESFSNHNLKVFGTLQAAFEYLESESEKPFIIICDNDWRNQNQTKLLSLMDSHPNMKLKSIPFIFFSASPQTDLINDAFENLNVQGYFLKHNEYEEIRRDLNSIVNYWERSIVPEILE